MTDIRTWCCAKSDVMNSDTVHDGVKTVNRVCLACYTHWYGALGAVKTYTRAEWDLFLDKKLKGLEI